MGIRAVFMQILNMSLTGSLVILAVCAARLLLKKAPKWISYALWGVVLLRLICPVSISAGFSLLGLLHAPVVDAGSAFNSMEYLTGGREPAAVTPVDPGGESVSGISEPAQEPAVGLSGEEAEQSGGSAKGIDWDAVAGGAAYVWLAGVIGMAGYSGISYFRLRRRMMGAMRLREGIYLVDHIPSPFVMGLFRPKVYLPSFLTEHEQEYILLHEQYHIRRRDPAIKLAGFAALCLHWFNPLVWLAFLLFERDMEMSCDEAVIRRLGEGVRADYSASLVNLAVGHPVISGTPLAFGEGDIRGRVRNLAGWRKPAVWSVAAAAAGCCLLAGCLLTNPGGSGELAWLQSLSEEDVAQMELVVMPQSEDRQYAQLSREEITDAVGLLRESKGARVTDPESAAGGGSTFYITLNDQTRHTVGNDGNRYLVVDGICYDAGYDWLSGWSEIYGAGNAPVPEDFFERWDKGEPTEEPPVSASDESSEPSGESGSSVPAAEGMDTGGSVPLSETEAAAFIEQTLRTLTIRSDETVTFSLPAQIPVSEDGKTLLTITLNATFSSEPGSFSVQNLLDWETDWEGGDTYRGTLDAGRGTLTDVMLRVAFMTEVEPSAYTEYAANYVEVSAPFTYDVPVGFTEPSAAAAVQDGVTQLAYTFRSGDTAAVRLQLPEGLSVAASAEAYTEAPAFTVLADGAPVGTIRLYPLGTSDADTLRTVQPSESTLPMQVFSAVALSNHAGYEEYAVQTFSQTGAVATARYVWQDLSAGGSAAAIPWQEADCVLAYDWEVMPCFVEIRLETGTLTQAELEEVARSLVLTPGS